MNTIEVMVANKDQRSIFTVANMAKQTKSDVRAIKGSAREDAKCIVGMMALELRVGDLVTFESEDVDTLMNIAGTLGH